MLTFAVTRPLDALAELPDFCPQCLNPLPAGYPFDHVAIDLALNGDPTALIGMREVELAEAYRVGKSRGISCYTIRRVLKLTESQYDRWERRWYRAQAKAAA